MKSDVAEVLLRLSLSDISRAIDRLEAFDDQDAYEARDLLEDAAAWIGEVARKRDVVLQSGMKT